MRRLFLLLCLTLAPATVSLADDCTNAQSQAAMNECADKSYKKSDAELNKLYKEIEAQLKDDPDATKLLVAAQRAWVAQRDAECDFAASGTAGGSAYPMVLTICLDGMTQDRIKDFQGYLTCEEGDMACPVPAAN